MNVATFPTRTQKVKAFIEVYSQLNAQNVNSIDAIYDSNIVFQDPLHRIEGIDALKRYMANMYQNISDYSLAIGDVVEQNQSVFMNWNMSFSHPKLNGGRLVSFKGASQLTFADKVTHHTDYFDAGAMLYEHIPVLGKIVKVIKRKAGQ